MRASLHQSLVRDDLRRDVGNGRRVERSLQTTGVPVSSSDSESLQWVDLRTGRPHDLEWGTGTPRLRQGRERVLSPNEGRSSFPEKKKKNRNPETRRSRTPKKDPFDDFDKGATRRKVGVDPRNDSQANSPLPPPRPHQPPTLPSGPPCHAKGNSLSRNVESRKVTQSVLLPSHSTQPAELLTRPPPTLPSDQTQPRSRRGRERVLRKFQV